jgi:hypothetical protein
MASKKSKAAEEAKAAGATSKHRDEALRADLIDAAMEREGLPADGSPVERANRLEAHFEHEWRKRGARPGEMADCFPPQLDDGATGEHVIVHDGKAYDVSPGNLGCFRSSPSALDACPFCGMTEVAAPAPLTPPKAEEKPAAKGNAKKAEPAPEPEPAEEHRPEDAAKTANAPATSGGVVRTNAASIRKNKGRKGAESIEAPKLDATEDEPKNEPNPAGETMTVPAAAPARDAPEEPTDAAAGATVADLDRQVARVKAAITAAETTNALSFWEQGDALREIIDKKLWCLVRNEGDGSPVYRSLGEFTANVFDMSQATAYSYKKIAQIFEREQAETLGFTRMKELVQAQDLPKLALDAVIERASKRAPNGQFVMSTRELRDDIAKEKRLLQGPTTVTGAAAIASAPSSAPVSQDEREDVDNNTVEYDDDGVVKEGATSKGKKHTPEPKTVTVSLADTRIAIPLFKKGSSVKPAKKLEDGCHGSFTGTNGIKGKIEIVIGEDAEIQVVISLARPD